MKFKTAKATFGLLLLCSQLSYAQTSYEPSKSQIVVDFSKPGVRVQPSMYGIFFEEINHSGDGGLYAELIQNRGFEDNTPPSGTKLENGFAVAPAKPNYRNGQFRNFRIPWHLPKQWPGWSLKQQGASTAVLSLTKEKPLNIATPQSMQIEINKATPNEPVELSNEGFWGVGVKQGEKYNLRFYLRTDGSYKAPVVARIMSTEGKILAQNTFPLKKQGQWNEYTAQLTSSETDAKATFVLGFQQSGKVWVDYVSLFPAATFKNHKNGLRADVAQLLADLKPAFVRWPGGCIVEGLTLENRVKWKETLGDPVNRPGEYDLWGYRNSYGFGYHEFLQFIEDIGSTGMFVANMGLSCSVRNGDYCSEDSVKYFIQDALDAIEYAIGDVKTPWGTKRAAAGHPAPFPLKYVEVGNENAGVLIYNQRYNLFHKAISEKYPQITIISNHGLNDNMDSIHQVNMIDPHYYVSPDWFYARANNLFDNMKPRPAFSSYVGEYAVNRNVGTGSLDGALSEAAFLIGMERNADFVTMASYAPLIENSNKRDWQVNLIWVNSNQSMGRSSYYVQKMFSDNRPTLNYPTSVQVPGLASSTKTFEGMLGFVTNRSKVELKDLTFFTNGASNNIDFNGWQPIDGQWSATNNTYIQNDTAGRHFSFMKGKTFGNGTLQFKVKKAARVGSGNAGGPGNNFFGRFGNNYSLLLGGTDEKNYYQLTFSNRFINLEKIVNGNSQYMMDPIRFAFEDERAYNIKVVTENDNIECFVDGQSILKHTYVPLVKQYAIAGIDESKNEIVVKVVNGEPSPFRTTINLNGIGPLLPNGEIEFLSSVSGTDENTFAEPLKIAPKKEKYQGFSPKFDMEFKPNSLTILRIKKAI